MLPRLSSVPGLTLACALLGGLAASPASAQISVTVNDRPVAFGAVQPAQVGGRVLIPLRAVVESLGADIKWEPATQTVRGSRGSQEFSLQIDSRSAVVNGRPVTLDVPAQLVRGTTMVPLRFVAEALGAEVEWQAAARHVAITASDGPPGGGGGGRVSGEVLSVRAEDEPPSITIRANGVRHTYRIGADTIILRGEEGARGASVDISAVRPGDQVRLRVNADTGVAEVVEATFPRGAVPAPAQGRIVTGEIVDLRTTGGVQTLTVQTESGRAVLRVPAGAVLMRGPAGRTLARADFTDLQVGDRVRLELDREGLPERLEATVPAPVAGALERVTGEVVAVRRAGNIRTVTIRTATGRTVYDVPEDVEITRVSGGRTVRAGFTDIQDGEQVRLTADRNGIAVRIELLGVANALPVNNGRVTGEVVAIRPDANPPTITLRSGTARATYELSPDALVSRAIGEGRPVGVTLNEIEPGDQVSLRLDRDGLLAERLDARAVAAPAPAPVPAADLRITSFSHDARETLAEGDQVRIVLLGTPGATASANVGSVAKAVPLREDAQRPGRYTGTFVVPKGTTAKEVTITGELRSGNRVAPVVQAGNVLTIDSEAPTITEVSPGDRSETTNQKPDIYAELSDGGGSGVDPNSLRMLVGGRDVTNQAKLTRRFLIYTPTANFVPGRVPVVISVKDAAGNATQLAWEFTVKPATAAVQSVTHNADRALRVGDTIVVTVQGQSRGQGTFSIGELVRAEPLEEEVPGTYIGRYRIREGDQVAKAPVVVDFIAPDGNRSRHEATLPVNIATRDAEAPEITFPRNNLRLGDELVVEGRAAPGSRVVVEVTWKGRALGALTLRGTFGSQEVTVDRRGNWVTEPFDARLPLGVRRPELTITATAVDAGGMQSRPTEAVITTR